MPSHNNIAWAILTLFAGSGGGASYANLTPAVPPQVAGQSAVPPTPITTPPPDLPAAEGPSGSSQTSADRYDEVGYASWYGDELRGHRTASGATFDPDWITAAHRSLPLGSFVEVTSLDTGRTILLQITDRGPHRSGRLIDLSLGAAKLLGVDRKSIAPVRVRLVDPPAPDQTALAEGRPASTRLDSPTVLLTGLRARLIGPAQLVSTPSAIKVAAVSPAVVARPKPSLPAPRPTAIEHLPPAKHSGSTNPAKLIVGKYRVQVAAFSNKARADELAKRLGGSVSPSGGFWRVRLGPFFDSADANRARDGAAKRGYGDARVVRDD